jgi:hypothetical protein
VKRGQPRVRASGVKVSTSIVSYAITVVRDGRVEHREGDTVEGFAGDLAELTAKDVTPPRRKR